MKRTLTLIFGLLFFNVASAQKVSTVLGDARTGEVVATNPSSREITIKYENKGKSETFTGVLGEIKGETSNGEPRNLSVAEIPMGTRVRVFSKTTEQQVNGRKIKVNLIWRIDFLGADEFARLRDQLKLASSTPVIKIESNVLPTAKPLKLYLAIEDPKTAESLVEWVETWNKKDGVKYGSIQIVSDMSEADVLLARYRGSNLIVEIMPTATAFLAVPRGAGLEVIWRQAFVLNSDRHSSPIIEKEIEKRMKARKK